MIFCNGGIVLSKIGNHRERPHNDGHDKCRKLGPREGDSVGIHEKLEIQINGFIAF